MKKIIGILLVMLLLPLHQYAQSVYDEDNDIFHAIAEDIIKSDTIKLNKYTEKYNNNFCIRVDDLYNKYYILYNDIYYVIDLETKPLLYIEYKKNEEFNRLLCTATGEWDMSKIPYAFVENTIKDSKWFNNILK